MSMVNIDLETMQSMVRGGTRSLLRSYFRRLRRETSLITGNLLVADRFFEEILAEDLDDLVERTNWPARSIARHSRAYLPSLAA